LSGSITKAGDCRFGSFPNKTKAREFYEKAKLEQKEGRFFPERYQPGGYALTEDLIAAHVNVSTVRNQAAEKHYGDWWKDRLKGKRLNAVIPACSKRHNGISWPRAWLLKQWFIT